jgi:hypothetical protein
MIEMEVLSPSEFRWGSWKLEADDVLLLEHESGYLVRLDEMTTSAQVLDWIMQVAGKSWSAGGAIDGLLAAIDDIVDPQATLCSGGFEQSSSGGPLTGEAIRRTLAARVFDRGCLHPIDGPGGGVTLGPPTRDTCEKAVAILRNPKWGEVTEVDEAMAESFLASADES